MDQQKSSLKSFLPKRGLILLLLFCTLSTVVFILIHQLVIEKKGESILNYFIGENQPSPSVMVIRHSLKTLNHSKPTCGKRVYYGGPSVQQPSKKLTLFGGQRAVCLDEKIAPKISDCLIYSFGIRGDWSFEESMEEHLGCHVYTFDHSMERGHQDHSKMIHFYPIALGSEDKAGNENEPWETKTLSSIYEMLSSLHGEDAIIDYLKINPEELDLAVLNQIVDSGFLKRVRQLSLTIDSPTDLTKEENKEYFMKIDEVLQRIGNEGEMVRFDYRGNTFKKRESNRKMTIYYAYELAWFNFGKLHGARAS